MQPYLRLNSEYSIRNINDPIKNIQSVHNIINGKINELNGVLRNLTQVEARSNNQGILLRIKIIKKNIRILNKEKSNLTNLFNKIINNHQINHASRHQLSFFQYITSIFSTMTSEERDLLEQRLIDKFDASTADFLRLADDQILFSNHIIDHKLVKNTKLSDSLNNRFSTLKREINNEINFIKNSINIVNRLKHGVISRETSLYWKFNSNIRQLKSYLKKVNELEKSIDVTYINQKLAGIEKSLKASHQKNMNSFKTYEFIIHLIECRDDPNQHNINKLISIIDELNTKFRETLVPILFKNHEIRNNLIELLPILKNGSSVSKDDYSELIIQNRKERTKIDRKIVGNIYNWGHWKEFNKKKIKYHESLMKCTGLVIDRNQSILTEIQKLIESRYSEARKLLKLDIETEKDPHEHFKLISENLNTIKLGITNLFDSLIPEQFLTELIDELNDAEKIKSKIIEFLEDEWDFIQSLVEGDNLLLLDWHNEILSDSEYEKLKISDENLRKILIFQSFFNEAGIKKKSKIKSWRISWKPLKHLLMIIYNRELMDDYFTTVRKEDAHLKANAQYLKSRLYKEDIRDDRIDDLIINGYHLADRLGKRRSSYAMLFNEGVA